MTIDRSRIALAIDIQKLAASWVVLVGCGGSCHLATSLVRSGVGRFTLIDGDCIAPENLCRTDFQHADLGRMKVAALGQMLESLGASVHCLPHRLTRACWGQLVGANLIIAATDSFYGQAEVNRFAVHNRTSALFAGLSRCGLGGEIVFWYPGLPCYRCLVSQRYSLHDAYPNLGEEPVSGTSTLFDLSWLDAIVGHLALGLLLRGTVTRFGQLIESLGQQNYLRLKIDPAYRQSGRDLVRNDLAIPCDNKNFTGWCVSAQCDPQRGSPPCPDCLAAGHRANQR